MLSNLRDQGDSPNIVIAMLQVFSLDVYALIDPTATLCFVTPLMVTKFDVLLNVLVEPFLVLYPCG